VTNLHEAITPTEEKDRFKKFQEAEKKRYRAEQQRFVNTFSYFKKIELESIQEVPLSREETIPYSRGSQIPFGILTLFFFL
jgi:hypothetical protein